MLVWDPVSQRNLPFGTLKTAALGTSPFGHVIPLLKSHLDKSKKEHNPRPCCMSSSFCRQIPSPSHCFSVKVFDLLYLNGRSLVDKSVSFRKKNLRNCIAEITGRIEFATEYRGKTAKDIRTRMDEVMENRGEGLVIKHPSAQYVLNGRNTDWIKVRHPWCFQAGPSLMEAIGQTRVYCAGA